MVIEKGYAKLNLGLEVVRKLEDGYHELDMIMTSINLYDELCFEDNPESTAISIESEGLNIDLKDNLVYQAIIALQDRFKINRGVRVKIKKRIPEQAGLGGGSADCAATLRGINKLWNLNLSNEELAEIGLELGSDVPFCIYNKTARVRGRGEELEFIEDMPFAYLVLVMPPFRHSTKAVFKGFTPHHENKGHSVKLKEAINEGDLNKIAENLFNDLEIANEIEINEIKTDLLASGALGASMSGSGSLVYGLCFNNEKNAQLVLSRYNNIIKTKYSHNAHKWQVELCSTRSYRRAVKSTYDNTDLVLRETRVLGKANTKAFAMLPLGYQMIMNHFKLITTPLSLWDNIIIQKLSQPTSEVLFSDGSNRKALELFIKELSSFLGYGLRINIKNDYNSDLITDNNYLSAIISGLAKFGCDTEKLYSLFSNQVRLYQDYQTIAYDSKTDKFEELGNAVFGYVLLVDLKIPNYQNPRYTRQADIDTAKLNAIKTGIIEENFYKMAASTFNGLEKFETRKIGEYRGRNFLKKIKDIAIKHGATGVYLSVDGRRLIIICRYQKQMRKISNILKGRFKLNNNIETSLKTDITHKESKSKILKVIPSSSMDEEYEYDESSPFENLEEEFEDIEYRPYRKPKRKKSVEVLPRRQDCEGILLLNSGGGIFKQYDFIDIANYFQKFFGGKYINFNLNGVDIPVEFNTEHLPHILGIHLLDEDDLTLRGRAGFKRLIAGDISYRRIKNAGKVNEKTLKTICNKTQSSVMIFNDIFHNRLDCFYCFPREIIVGGNTKMEKFEYGITRMLTGSSFHRQNLLGIGRDQKTDKYFFYTSFIWQVPAHIGKKDSYRMFIS